MVIVRQPCHCRPVDRLPVAVAHLLGTGIDASTTQNTHCLSKLLYYHLTKNAIRTLRQIHFMLTNERMIEIISIKY